jgi:hypothetical protein
MLPVVNDSVLAFVVEPVQNPGLEIRVNFGVFSGRQATPAEIDKLAAHLLGLLETVTIVAEERHEIGTGAEASVHQVRIELEDDRLPPDPVERHRFEGRLLAQVESWARNCIEDRHLD